jgi:uncharacterized PurR-regulated membrane protein YhhQ (DUF165 family)
MVVFVKWMPLAGYIATIFAANYSIQHWGDCSLPGPCTIPVWPGIVAPSGVLWVGVAFTLRDFTQDALGRWWTYVAIVAGAALSGLLSGPLALASGMAFLVSETADLLVYTPLRERHWLWAVALSNTVGLVVDSILFLWLAFGSLAFLAGQVIGKAEMTVLAVVALWGVRALFERLHNADVASQSPA